MDQYILRRLLLIAPILTGTITLNFFIVQIAPIYGLGLSTWWSTAAQNSKEEGQ